MARVGTYVGGKQMRSRAKDVTLAVVDCSWDRREDATNFYTTFFFLCKQKEIREHLKNSPPSVLIGVHPGLVATVLIQFSRWLS